MIGLNKFELERNIKAWLEEDMPFGDITSDFILDDETIGEGELIAKEEGVLCGMPIFETIYQLIDSRVIMTSFKKEGDVVEKLEIIGMIEGPISSILKGERLGLNIIQRLSGIATMSKEYANMVADLETRVVDTRKTTPGLRALEKYAVRVGGCTNHRYSLSDAVLIKDNHIAGAGSITKAVEKVKKSIPHTVKIEVEVETLAEVLEGINAGADILMLDNMSIEMMTEAVGLIRQTTQRKITVEASGNMVLSRIRDVANTGVDIISVGALTHSVRAMDISLKFKKQ